MKDGIKILHGLYHADYEHEFDKKALENLEKVKFLSQAMKWVTENTVEKIYTVQYTGSNIKVTSDNYPRIYQYLLDACEILDLHQIPDLYIEWGYNINAFTVGCERPIIVLNSGLIDLCTDEEIMFIIGHECGHIKSNHMLYHMMAQLVDIIVAAVPGGNLLAGGFQYALYYWDRMSELTADRAGLLCCQDEKAAVHSFMKMAGLPKSEYANLNYETFIQQAHDFNMLDFDGMNKIYKLISIADSSHPWTVMRASELLNWIADGKYAQFLK